MNNPEIQMLSDIAVKAGRLEALQDANAKAVNDMANSVNKLVEKMDKSDDIAKEAMQSARSAHHKLNTHDKIIFWAGTTIIGAIIIGAITLLFKIKGA